MRMSGVAMVSSVFYPSIGGAQRVVLDTGRLLRARGVDVFVITRHYRGLARYEEVNTIPTYRVGYGDGNKVVAALSFMLGALWILWKLRRRYAVVHCHQMISPMTIGLLAKGLFRRALVIMPHRSGDIGDIGVLTLRRPITGRMRLAAARRCGDAFVCISPAIHTELRTIGVPSERLWDITNGVDVERIRPVTPEQRAQLRHKNALPQTPLAIFTGRLVEEKGLTVLLAAWPAVLQQIPDAHLVLVGAGDQAEALQAQAQQLGIASHVIFAGSRDDVAPLLQASNVFVLPSYAEGLPVALLEALACGLPCVGTAIDGTMQIINDQVTGRLVPVGDSNKLAAALIEAFAPEAATWGQHGRTLITQHYALDAVITHYLELYQAIASNFHHFTPTPVAQRD